MIGARPTLSTLAWASGRVLMSHPGMPFGISPAPECFQRKLDQNLEGLEGIYKVADDILITSRGTSKEQAVKNHDANLLKL